MSVERILEDVKDLQRANEYLKSQVKVMKEIIENAGEIKPRHCDSCRNFIPHYIQVSEYSFRKIDCGHCILRGKGRKRRSGKHATDAVCEFYKMGEYGK